MKTNIVFVSLDDKFAKSVGEKLAEEYDMYFADIFDILQYNLANEKEIEKLCGKEYLNKLKQKTIKDVSTYENTIISLPYSFLIEGQNAEYYKKYGTIVFLKLTKKLLKESLEKNLSEGNVLEKDVSLMTFEEHTQLCEEKSELIIDVSKIDGNIFKKIENAIDSYLI